MWWVMASLAAALTLGFIAGFGVRELISKRRRAEARRRYFLNNPY
jgi:hypothetical protein